MGTPTENDSRRRGHLARSDDPLRNDDRDTETESDTGARYDLIADPLAGARINVQEHAETGTNGRDRAA